eukprot:8323-Heterococcus_DN1.PRE.4
MNKLGDSSDDDNDDDYELVAKKARVANTAQASRQRLKASSKRSACHEASPHVLAFYFMSSGGRGKDKRRCKQSQTKSYTQQRDAAKAVMNNQDWRLRREVVNGDREREIVVDQLARNAEGAQSILANLSIDVH